MSREALLAQDFMVIAVDGPAASGKGTLARQLAAHFGLHYLDTGSLYRGLALRALETNQSLDIAAGLVALVATFDDCLLKDPRLREPGVGDAASKIASLPEVRAALLSFQRSFASRQPGAVLDGRDIGTVVCPDADVKLFVTASAEERARRRHKELVQVGSDLTYSDTLADIQRRDERDSTRSIAPLQQSDDAHLLDTTNLDIETAMSAAVLLVQKAIKDKYQA